MNPKTQKKSGKIQNIAARNRSLAEKVHPGFIQPIHSRALYFTVTSMVDGSFIVDWQLDDI
jgi:hypothetical protein